MELNKSSTITSSTGYVAKIDYSGKGWVTGKKNSFTATLSKEGSKDILYTIDGQWTDSFSIKEGKSKKEVCLFLCPTHVWGVTYWDIGRGLQREDFQGHTPLHCTARGARSPRVAARLG